MGRSLGEVSRCRQRPFTSFVRLCRAILGGTGALTEMERVINRRPITYLWELSDPSGGVPLPLCPEQFLLPPREDVKEEERELNLSEEFLRRKKWLFSVTELWKKEYLHQVLGSQGEVWKTEPNPLKKGEVVLAADDREKCLNWKMGVVRKLITGRDGGCRAAVVQVKSGMLRRPIRKMYKLELYTESDDLPPITSSLGNSDEEEAELTEDKEEEEEVQVTLPQRTQRGREVVRPRRFKD